MAVATVAMTRAYGDGLTNDSIVIYSFCAATELPANRPLATGDEVTIDYLQLPGDERLATRVQLFSVDPNLSAVVPLAKTFSNTPKAIPSSQWN